MRTWSQRTAFTFRPESRSNHLLQKIGQFASDLHPTSVGSMTKSRALSQEWRFRHWSKLRWLSISAILIFAARILRR
jgi:hypothetical protein